MTGHIISVVLGGIVGSLLWDKYVEPRFAERLKRGIFIKPERKALVNVCEWKGRDDSSAGAKAA